MQTTQVFFTLALGLSLAAGCARTKADEAPVSETPASSDRGTADAPAVRSLNVSGVYLDQDIATACGITTPNAYFEFDSAEIESQANGTLQQVATCLMTGPLRGKTVELVGHADPRGTDAYNQELGMSRADSVRAYLVKSGVQDQFLTARSVGEQGTDPNDASEWPWDRRVDIRLVR